MLAEKYSIKIIAWYTIRVIYYVFQYLYSSISGSWMLSLEEDSCCEERLFKIEKTHSAADDDGWSMNLSYMCDSS